MKVHNIMEEYVEARVDAFYDKLNEEKATWLTCDCEICRGDAVGFVLNRIPPRYVVSSRGATHNTELMNDSQLRADVDTLINQGVHMINSVQRPYHTPQQKRSDVTNKPKVSSFNFPVFTGSIYDGSSFDTLLGVDITLKNPDGTIAKMFDTTWENPCKTYKVTDGAYTFWVKPLPAEKAGINQTFHFTIDAKKDGYVPVTYGFDVHLTSDEDIKETMDSSCSIKIPDFFMFSVDEHNPMED